MGAARLARAESGNHADGERDDGRRLGNRAGARRSRVPLDAPQEQVRQRLPDECRALAGVRRGVQAFLAGRTATFAGMSAVSAEVPQFRERLLKAAERSNVLDQAEEHRRLLSTACWSPGRTTRRSPTSISRLAR